MRLACLSLPTLYSLAFSFRHFPPLESRSNTRLGMKMAVKTEAAGACTRCARCSRKLKVCICSALPSERIALNTRVIILQHPGEHKNVSCCSVPVVRAVLAEESCRVVVGEEFPEGACGVLDEALRSPQTLILFPASDALPIASVVPSPAAAPAPRVCRRRPARAPAVLQAEPPPHATNMQRDTGHNEPASNTGNMIVD